MKTILIGTKNPAKYNESARFLNDLPAKLVSLTEIAPTLEVEESGTTFEENAILKAVTIAGYTGLPTIANDGGIELPALGGWPGVSSRRHGGERDLSDEELIRSFSETVRTIPENERKFVFRVVYAFALPSDMCATEEACLEGKITLRLHPKEIPGFPYRRFWYLPQFEKYYLDLSEREFLSINHNRLAIEKIKPAIRSYLVKEVSYA